MTIILGIGALGILSAVGIGLYVRYVARQG